MARVFGGPAWEPSPGRGGAYSPELCGKSSGRRARTATQKHKPGLKAVAARGANRECQMEEGLEEVQRDLVVTTRDNARQVPVWE